MNILLLSDLHLETPGFVPYPNTEDISANVDVIVLAGDIHAGTQGVEWAQKKLSCWPVLYVPGNHEFYGGEYHETLANMRQACLNSNVQLLERDCAVIGSTRFLGATLWTDFLLFADPLGEDPAKEQAWAMADAACYMSDFDGRVTVQAFSGQRPVRLTPAHTAQWHGSSLSWLKGMLNTPFAGQTVVISHHAPCPRSVAPQFARHRLTPAYASQLDSTLQYATCWLHGHVHHDVDYEHSGCRIVSRDPQSADHKFVDLGHLTSRKHNATISHTKE
jgi:Icc-related predicted phosphoesterase